MDTFTLTSSKTNATIIGTTDRTYILINKNGTGAETFPIEQGLFSYVEQSTGYISLATNDYIEFRLDWDGYATGDDVRVETYQFDTMN